MSKLLFIAAGGACGALLRYGLEGLVHRFLASDFPWGTFAVNLAGCLLIGLIWSLSERNLIAPSGQAFLIVGLIGSFTTFSTYTLQSLNLVRDGELMLGLANLAGSVVFGIGATVLGLMLAQHVLRWVGS